MKTLLNFFIENWPTIAPIVYEILIRIWPTKWNLSILDNAWKLLNSIIPNKRVPDGNENGLGTNAAGKVVNQIRVPITKHILRALLIVCLFNSVASAQIWQNFKGIRSVNESDTTEQLAVEGSFYYDEVAKVFYGRNQWGWKEFSFAGASGNFWPLSGEATFTAPVTIYTDGHGFQLQTQDDPNAFTRLDLNDFGTSGFYFDDNSNTQSTFYAFLDEAGISFNGDLFEVDATGPSVFTVQDFDIQAVTTNITGNINLTPTDSDSEIYFGEYNPTITAVANCSATSGGARAKFTRIGNIVTVTGTGSITVTVAATNTDFTISLPIATNFANGADLYGLGNAFQLATDMHITADVAGDVATCRALPPDTGARAIMFQFTYELQ